MIAAGQQLIQQLHLREYLGSSARLAGWQRLRGSLLHKYVGLLLAVASLALLTGGLSQMWFSYREHKVSLTRIQGEQASAAANKISQFVKEIESQIGWTTLLPWSEGALEQRRFDGRRLLRQVRAISELSQLDAAGRERLRVSRLAMDVVGSQVDYSEEPKFREAVARTVYYGPVYFRHESEPYMTLSVVGSRRDAGVSVAEVNLRFIWDVVSQIKVGERGRAYLLDGQGRLIAHPDISLVLRNTDLSHLAQVQAARANVSGASREAVQEATDVAGRRVLAAYAPVAPLGWLVFTELPIEEAHAPLVASMRRSVLLLLLGLLLTLAMGMFLARKMIGPIRALGLGAARIGSGDLGQRISIKTGDELEALGEQFNRMAERLQESYATLERKVEERTSQLELANLAKSRFLAAASHDLRQPLHALGLFVAQLQSRPDSPDRDRLFERINASVAAMNELFNALLDISKLDAGVLNPNITEFFVEELLDRVETTFADAAREKGLSLRFVRSRARVRSDFILLERILLNLVSNAVRYTARGGVVVGCRPRGSMLRIEVCDSGPGIADREQANIFDEFYRLEAQEDARQGGLGLGLAIVDRLSGLLAHPIQLDSVVGKGSRFAVTVPLVAAKSQAIEPTIGPREASVRRGTELVVVIDDDRLALEGLGGLLRSWGYAVVAAASDRAALAAVNARGKTPGLIIADYRLAEGKTGVEAIEALRSAFGEPVPAFLISGDTAPDPLREVRTLGYHLVHKPVTPMALRATLDAFLKQSEMAARREAGRSITF
jgi:signal transduction histidine kinase/CheY-like chemotaxis protein